MRPSRKDRDLPHGAGLIMISKAYFTKVLERHVADDSSSPWRRPWEYVQKGVVEWMEPVTDEEYSRLPSQFP